MNNAFFFKKTSLIKKKKKIFAFMWAQKNLFFLKNIKNHNKIWIDSTTEKFIFNSINVKNIKENLINTFFYSGWFLLFNKLKFNGKGYKIKKNQKKTVQLLFNFSHKTYLYLKKTILKKIGKNKLILLSTKNKIIQNCASKCLTLRSSNIYTKRGLRLARCLIKKKNGKKTNN